MLKDQWKLFFITLKPVSVWIINLLREGTLIRLNTIYQTLFLNVLNLTAIIGNFMFLETGKMVS